MSTTTNVNQKRNTIIAVSIATVVAVILIGFIVNSHVKMNAQIDLAKQLEKGQISYSMYCDSLEKIRELSTSEKIDCVRAYLR